MLRSFTSPACMDHQVPFGFPELPERLGSILEALRNGGVPITEVASGSEGPAWDAVVALHDEAYLERFRRAVERGDGLLDSADNPLSPATWDAAWGAVQAALAACDWAMEASGRRAFVAARPPGHHAEPSMAMGFCYLGTAAVAAQHLVSAHGLERVAIFDFDVHHGNGTQHLLEERGDLFYASTHQWPFYPGTGAASETGRGAGEGATLNVPLPAGCGDAEYERAILEDVLPALARFAPDVLIVSAGFDAWCRDPLGGMDVSLEGFEAWGRWLGDFADERCEGRIVSVLEGGYDLAMLPELAVSHLVALDGASSPGGES